MSFCGVVVETAMNVAFPALMGEFGITTGTVQWVTTAYLLVLTCIMPLSSILKRRFRTKHLFVVAVVLFIVGTVLCLLAPNFGVLVAGRVIEGVGTGIALPLMFNIILEQAPLNKMGFMMGLGTLISALAPAVGPSLGGFIIGLAGWRMIFAVLLPFLVLAAIGGLAAIRQVSETEAVSFSLPQFAALAGSFACLIFATTSAGDLAANGLRIAVLLAAFVALAAVFCHLSLHSVNPLIRVRIFRQRSFTLSVVYVFLLQGIVLGLGYLIPYYGQVVLGLSEFAGGCLLLPGCILGAILAPLGGSILDKMGARRPLMFGAAVQLAAMACFWLFGFGQYAWVVAAVYMLIPLSQGFSMANSITNGITYLSKEYVTDGNAMFNTMQQLGGAVGTALATTVVNLAQTGLPGDVVAGTVLGTHQAALLLLVVSAAAFACMVGVFAGEKGGAGASRAATAHE